MFVHLDLNGRVFDPKPLVQIVGQLSQGGVARVTCWHHAMTGQGGLGRAHGPDVQIVNRGNARPGLQVCADLLHLQATRHRVE